jgi:hypothetical protein
VITMTKAEGETMGVKLNDEELLVRAEVEDYGDDEVDAEQAAAWFRRVYHRAPEADEDAFSLVCAAVRPRT